MLLRVAYWVDSQDGTLQVGKCASDDPLNEEWRDFAFELIARALGHSALIVILPPYREVDDYDDVCAQIGVACRRVPARSPRGNIRDAVYYARPTCPSQTKSLAEELADDPAWFTQGCLSFCRSVEGTAAEELGPKDWLKAVSLKCNIWDDDLLECCGSGRELEAIKVALQALADETGAQLIRVESRAEVRRLIGWDRPPLKFWDLLRLLWRG